MPVNAGAVGAVAAAVGVPITMRALARLFPASPAPRETALTLDELRSRYKSWEVGLGFGALLGAVPFAFLFWLALRALAAAHAALLPPAELVWVTAPYFWSIPAMFLGLVVMFPVGGILARRLLADRHTEYVAYQQLKYRMNAEKVARILGTVVSLAAAVFVLLGLDWSVRADREGLTLNRFLSIGEERHAWADVRAIRTAPALVAPNGNRVARREYVVRFSDGRSWSTNGDLSDASPAEKRRLAALIAESSGVAIEEVRILRNDEL